MGLASWPLAVVLATSKTDLHRGCVGYVCCDGGVGRCRLLFRATAVIMTWSRAWLNALENAPRIQVRAEEEEEEEGVDIGRALGDNDGSGDWRPRVRGA